MYGADWGGSEELWGQTAGCLAETGYNVHAAVSESRRKAENLKKLQRQGCPILPIITQAPQRWMWPFQRNRKYGWLDRIRPALAVISQGANFDGLDWMSACIERNIPFVTISQAATPLVWPSDSQFEQGRQCFVKAKMNYFVSRHNLSLTEKQFGIRLPHSKVIRNPYKVRYGIKLDWPSAAQEGFRLACLGRLNTNAKGQDLLLEVLADHKWRVRPLQVDFYGAGPHEASLRALADSLKLDQVHFQKRTEDIEGLWATHHALILPSRWEGLPLVLVEAMMCGRTAIVTDVGGNSEIVDDNQTGFMAQAPTAVSLDEAMERAWQARDCWEEIGKKAQHKIQQMVPPHPAEIFSKQLIECLA